MFRVISILNVARFSSSRLTYSTDHIETHAKFYESHNRTESEINRVTWSDKRKMERYGHNLWRPKKRLTRYQMEHLRTLRQEAPNEWTIQKLAKQFQISYSAVTRILRSKFEPSDETQARQDKIALERRKSQTKH